MPKVKIIAPTAQSGPRVFIDDVEIPALISVEFVHRIKDVARIRLEGYCFEGADIEADAEVTYVAMCPKCRAEEVTRLALAKAVD